MYIYYDGELTAQAALKTAAAGFQFGYGVFETVLVKQGVPCFFEAHYERLANACEMLGLQLNMTADAMHKQGVHLASFCGITEGRMKIICFRDENKDAVIMTIVPYHLDQKHYEKGYSLMASSIKRNPYSPLCYIKSLNYLENILARDEAKQEGYDEALLLNIHGKLCEGAVSNLFWIKGEELYTPHVSCGLLKGIAREQIIRICRRQHLKLHQGEYDLTELEQADEVFLTNSLMGIMPVSRIENNMYDVLQYKLTRALDAEYKELIRAELENHRLIK